MNIHYPRYQIRFCLIVALLFSHDVFAFEVNGFKDGMTKSAVNALATKKLSTLVWNEAESVYGGVDTIAQEGYTFAFCGDSLVSLTRGSGSQPTLFNAIALLDIEIAARGNPTKVFTSTYLMVAAVGGGQGRSVIFEWLKGHDIFKLTISTPDKPIPGLNGEALTNRSFSTVNSCGN